MSSFPLLLRLSQTAYRRRWGSVRPPWREINAAAQHQREHGPATSAAIEYQGLRNQIRALREELETERERNRKLAGMVATMEANAGRLGFDPEEMYKPLMKPIRSISHAGQGGPTAVRGPRTN